MSFDRKSALTLALLALSLPILLAVLGPVGLVVYVGSWMAALPILLAPLRRTLVAELSGALFFFATAAFADNLDDALGTEQRVSLLLVATSFLYLALRTRDAADIVRTPPVLLLVLFYAQQLVSAWWFGADGLTHLVQNRVSLVAALVAGGVLARRDRDGGALVLWLLVLAALVSVPIALYEVARPDARLFSFSGGDGPVRAGGLFGQSNVLGIAIDLAIAALLALRARGDLSRGAAALLGVALGLGLLACASRGAVLVALALLAVRAWSTARRRAGRAPLATALLACGLFFFGLPALGRTIVSEDRQLASVGFEGIERLNEVVLALTGSTSDLAEDDSGHAKLAEASIELGLEHPFAGVGTGKFAVAEKGDDASGAHMQLLQIFGENGAAGIVLYFVFLGALVAAAMRSRQQLGGAGLLLVGVWLMAHFESHDLHSYRFTMLPLAWIAGRTARSQGGAT